MPALTPSVRQPRTEGTERTAQALTDRLRDATTGLLQMLEFTRSRMVGVEMLQTYATQARILLQLYDEHQSMMESLMERASSESSQSGALTAQNRGMHGDEIDRLLVHARRISLYTNTTAAEKETLSCVICQSEIRQGKLDGELDSELDQGDTTPCAMHCGHIFHRQCIGTSSTNFP